MRNFHYVMVSNLVGRVRRALFSITTSVIMVGPDCQADSSTDISQYIKGKENKNN